MVEVTEHEDAVAVTADRGGPPSDGTGDREWARKQVEKKHKLRADLAAYVVINLFLIGAWAATGFGYFWPGWVLAGWGMLLFLDAWNTYVRRPVSEDEVDRELSRRR